MHTTLRGYMGETAEIRGLHVEYVVFFAAGSLNRSPEYPIQAGYASTDAILRKLEPLLRTARATGSTAGHR
jgi:hypothetical protein